MGEVKRLFNQAKIERDVDARMLPPGTYRDALNVNVGESEGGDVGAVENLKGNEEIAGQTTIVGTTIGSVRDPNNDKVYWFNKGATTDAIYEYDESNDSVSTILIDSVARDKVKPQCAPELRPFLDLTPDDPNMRPSINILFTAPVGGCTNTGAFNYNAAAEFDNGTCIPRVTGCMDPSASNYNSSANTAGACSYPPPPNNITVSISGAGTFPDASSPVTLTASAGGTTGTVSFLWSTGETTSSISVSGTGTTINGSVTATDDNGSATATYTVVFSTAPIVTYNLSASTGGGVTNSSVAGGIGSEQGIQGTPETISFQSTITPSSGFQWSGTAPTFTVSGLPAGVTAGAVAGGTTGTNAASVTISGTWNPIADATITVTWTGGGIEVATVPFQCSLTGAPLQLASSGSSNSISIFTTPEVPFSPTFGKYIFNITGPTGATSATATQLSTGTPGVNGFRFTSSSNPGTEPLGMSGNFNTFTAGDSTPPGNYSVSVTANHPSDGRSFTTGSCPFTVQAAVVPTHSATATLLTPNTVSSFQGTVCNYQITSTSGYVVSGGALIFVGTTGGLGFTSGTTTTNLQYFASDINGNVVGTGFNFGPSSATVGVPCPDRSAVITP